MFVEQKKKQKTMKFPIILSILLSVFFIVLILVLTVDPSDLDDISRIPIRYEFFAAAIFLNFLSWCIWGLRLKVLSSAADPYFNVGWWESTKIVMANLFLAGVTPSMAGGEPVRIYLLNKDGLSFGCATASVLGERLVDAIFLLVCVPFAFLVFRDKTSIAYINIGLTIGIIVFLVCIVLFLYAIFRPEKTKNFLIWLNGKLSRFSKKKEKTSKVIRRINKEVDNFHHSMMVFLRERRSTLLVAGFLTVIMWACAWLIPSMILMGLGLHHYLIESIAAQVFLIIIIMMPTTPGGAGVTELGVGGLYSIIISSVPGYYLGVFVIIFRFITYHMNLIVGAVFMNRIFKSVASFSMDMIKKQEEKNKG
jgi:uncharacterized protein (TIRG00374 family)